MGEREDALTTGKLRQHEARIAEARDDLASTIDELRHRTSRATDWRLQLRLHPNVVRVSLGLVAAGVIGGIALLVRRRRKRPHGLVDTLRLLAADPQRFSRPRQSVGKKAAGAALSSFLSAAGKRAATRVVHEGH